MPLIVYRSNRTERLLDALADVVRKPAATTPTSPEAIVVQGGGMAHWVALELARRLGIWANRDFPFPRAFMERVLHAAVGETPGAAAAFQPETLRWRVAAALVDCRERRELAPVRHYLDDDPRGVKTLQLAALVADTFDQYLVYRPGLILGWEGGEDSGDWQAVLWRRVAGGEAAHIARRARRFSEEIRCRDVADALIGRFPRVSVFGMSTLPPLYLRVLTDLSSVVPVHLFTLSPTHHYWADVRSSREVARELGRRRRGGTNSDDAADLHFEAGHPLLASMGRLGREFQDLLEGLDDYVESPDDLFVTPEGDSMLVGLQRDLLRLRHRGSAGASPPLTLNAADRSISVHACHGPMREVEVLHDQLLACFDADPSLAAHDVVVMCPDIETYAPYIDAVFGRPAGDAQAIPYRVSDRRYGATDEVAVAFFRLLGFTRPRATATAVLDLLALEPVRQGAGLELADLGAIRGWVAHAGIRWGRDAEDRAVEGQPAAAANTWRFGLDRLLLGYAMDGRDQRLFGGVLPVDGVEGSQARALGLLAAFCDRLFAWRERLRRPRSPAAWERELTGLLAAFLPDTNPYAQGCRRLRQTLVRIAERAAAAGYDQPLEIEGMEAEIEADLEREAPLLGFLVGPVTFCALVPMRSIPFRVVCLLGMNDAAFPRSRRPPSFDRRARHPEPGDRSPREDDRYLFLEGILSARERLIVTYEGQSCRDNAVVPPSVVVSELLDVLDESFRLPGDNPPPVRTRVVVKHPLQPFSPRYFQSPDAGDLFSYAQGFSDGAAALVRPRQAAPRFVTAPLPIEGPVEAVALDDLIRFFAQPARAFCRQRLRLQLREDEAVIEDREPIELNTLDTWHLGGLALRHAGSGIRPEDALALLRAAGRLPLGTPGDCAFAEVSPVALAIHGVASAFRVPPLTPLLPVDLELGGIRLSGVLRDVWSTGLVLARYAKVGGVGQLETWIRHLALCAVLPAERAAVSTLVGRADKGDGIETVQFAPVVDARCLLEVLLALYRIGLEQPLPLFSRASRAFADAALNRRTDPSLRARTAFDGNPFKDIPGDVDDPAVQRVFAGCDPLDGTVCVPDPRGGPEALGFSQLALLVFGPLYKHLRLLPREEGESP